MPSYTLSAIQPLRDHPSVGKLTKTNDVPTAEQERTLRDMISDLKTRLDYANTSTERLKAVRAELNRRIDDQLDLLERESGALRLAISDRSAVLAVTPMRRLPSELLVHIFSYTVTFPGIQTFYYNNFPRKAWCRFKPIDNALWSVELVCRRWRHELLACPQLWSSVTIVINDDTMNLSYLSRIGEHLSRAGLSQLSICIAVCHDQFSEYRSALRMEHLTALLLPVASRIQGLDLALPPHMIATFLPLRFRFRSLKWLKILNPLSQRRAELPSQSTGLTVFDSCPLIRTLELDGIDIVTEMFDLPWECLTTLSMTSTSRLGPIIPNPIEAICILSVARRLEKCSLRLEFCSSPEELDLLPSIPTNIVDLTVCGGDLTLRQLIGKITCPMLDILSVTREGWLPGVGDDHNSGEETFTLLIATVRQWRCQLTEFTYLGGTINALDVTALLNQCPTLDYLSLWDVVFDIDEMLLALILKPTVPPSAGYLTTLQLRVFLPEARVFSVDNFVLMVESRLNLQDVLLQCTLGQRDDTELKQAFENVARRLKYRVDEGFYLTTTAEQATWKMN